MSTPSESSVRQWRKKPVIVEAMQWDGSKESRNIALGWIGSNGGTATWTKPLPDAPTQLAIDTLEGTMRADAGDWIVRGTRGEFYPCKPDAFTDTFEPYEEPACPAVLVVRGEHHRCEWLPPHPGLAHTSSTAEAIWTDDPAPLAAAWASAEEAGR